MLIYYAHSKLIYNTEKEKEEFSIIKDNFKDDIIINPNGWVYDNGKEKDIMEQCYIFVKQSDVIVFSMIEDEPVTYTPFPYLVLVVQINDKFRILQFV